MRLNRVKRRSRARLPVILLAVAVALTALILLNFVNRRVTQEQADTLYQALTTAAVDCYATEGHYPATLEYLCKNYGVSIDEAHFHVTYDIFGANVIPEIRVSLKEVSK